MGGGGLSCDCESKFTAISEFWCTEIGHQCVIYVSGTEMNLTLLLTLKSQK